MKVTGWIVDPENRILGATLDSGPDVVFDSEDQFHRSEIESHAMGLAVKYLRPGVELPAEHRDAVAQATMYSKVVQVLTP